MTRQEKIDKFIGKDGRTAYRSKTPLEELPLEFKYGSGTANPDNKGGMRTSDVVLWVNFLGDWFKPYGHFQKDQILKMVDICKNDNQVIALMELLSAKVEDKLTENKLNDE